MATPASLRFDTEDHIPDLPRSAAPPAPLPHVPTTQPAGPPNGNRSFVRISEKGVSVFGTPSDSDFIRAREIADRSLFPVPDDKKEKYDRAVQQSFLDLPPRSSVISRATSKAAESKRAKSWRDAILASEDASFGSLSINADTQEAYRGSWCKFYLPLAVTRGLPLRPHDFSADCFRQLTQALSAYAGLKRRQMGTHEGRARRGLGRLRACLSNVERCGSSVMVGLVYGAAGA